MTSNEYRRKHKRCQTCIYWKMTISYDDGWKMTISYDDEHNFCKVKRKGTKYNSGKFCKCYKERNLKNEKKGKT